MEAERSPQRESIGVRKFRPEDADAVIAIAEEAPEAASWSRASYAKFAEENWAVALVIETHEGITGFLTGRSVAGQAEILNLAVGAKHRRRGEGTALLAAALEGFRSSASKSVYLEVRESNTRAISFYERHGFTKTGRRNGYYRNPDEAAITMERELTGPAD